MYSLKFIATDDDALVMLELLRPRIMFVKAVIDKTNTITGDIQMLLLTDSQQVDLAIKPLTKKGHPAQVDGTPEWSTSNSAVCTVEPTADGLSALVKAAADLGTVQVSVTADADLGAGYVPISGVLDIEVVGGGAATVSIIAGTPTEQE